MIKKQNRGFTLIEVLIYTAILGTAGSLLSGILFNATKIKGRETAVIEVNSQLSFALQNIQRDIMDSSIIDIDAGASTSTLVLKFKDSTKNPTEFYISGGVVYKKVANGTPQPLTDNNVIADAISFLKISGYSGHDSVQMDLTLSYNTNNPTFSFSRTLSSAIARVSAATFDSNLIPGTTSFYDIGTTALPWNNVYINGSVGIGNTAPLSKLGVTGNASVGATYGVIAAPTSGMIIEGNVGIGTTNPQKKLDISTSAGNSGPLLSLNNRGDTGIGYYNGITFGLDSNSYPNQYGKGGILYESRDGYNRGKLHLAVDNTADSSNVALADAILTADGTTGNVGIGTTNPTYLLDINGNFRANGIWTNAGVTYWGNPATPTAYGTLTWDTGYASIYANSGNVLKLGANGIQGTMTINDGNVGIGTAAPANNLEVKSAISGTYAASTQQVVARLWNVASTGGTLNSAFLSLQASPDAEASNPIARIGVVGESYGTNLSSFVVSTRDASGITERMRITSAGNVDIVGTTTALSFKGKGSYLTNIYNGTTTIISAYSVAQTSATECITGSTLSLNTNGQSRIMVTFAGAAVVDSSTNIRLSVKVDGVIEANQNPLFDVNPPAANSAVNMSFTYVTGILSEASHSVCLALYTSAAGTVSTRLYPRLTIMELK